MTGSEPNRSDSVVTCWTVVHGAAAGDGTERDRFALLYAPVVHVYLASRWTGTPLLVELDDAEQEVFVECFKQGGALERATRGGAGGFRAFLHGVTNNVARRFERRRARRREQQDDSRHALADLVADDAELADAFDRAWVGALLDQAVNRQAECAAGQGEAARRRVEILRLRFRENLSIRTIADRLEAPPSRIHHEYAAARREFERALREVLTFHNPSDPRATERELLRISGAAMLDTDGYRK